MVKSTLQKNTEGKGKERVEGCGRKYAGGGTPSKLKRILEEKVQDKTFGKYEKLMKVQEEKEVRECGTRHRQKKFVSGEIERSKIL